jgi:hypothetical protein
MAHGPVSRVSTARILADLRTAARTGDRARLTVAVDQMRILALSPRYWPRYLVVLRHPLARLVDLLVIKQGERIARQKGWTLPRVTRAVCGGPEPPRPGRTPRRRGVRPDREGQRTLFDDPGGRPRRIDRPAAVHSTPG